MGIKFIKDLTEAQQDELHELADRSENTRVRNRARAVLMSFNRVSIDQIAHIFNVCRDTIGDWLLIWEREGIEGLEDKPRSGRPPILAQTDEVKKKSNTT